MWKPQEWMKLSGNSLSCDEDRKDIGRYRSRPESPRRALRNEGRDGAQGRFSGLADPECGEALPGWKAAGRTLVSSHILCKFFKLFLWLMPVDSLK